MKKLIIILLAAICLNPASAQTLADQADQAYSAEKYSEAISLYKEAIAKDGVSSDMWYNLGNAYYRADSLAQSIICYERALMLDPTNVDARTNLNFVNTKIVDARGDTTSYSTLLIDRTVQMFKADTWAVIAIIAFLITLGLAAGYIFGNGVRLRKVCFFSGLVMIGVTAICITVTIAANARVTTHDKAVVISPAAQLSTSPSTPVSNSQQAFLLHEGTVVTVLDSVATPLDPASKLWLEVMVDNEHRAWIPRTDVEII